MSKIQFIELGPGDAASAPWRSEGSLPTYGPYRATSGSRTDGKSLRAKSSLPTPWHDQFLLSIERLCRARRWRDRPATGMQSVDQLEDRVFGRHSKAPKRAGNG
jgi:hypothetical protein